MAISLPLAALVPDLSRIHRRGVGSVVMWGLLKKLENVNIKSNHFQTFDVTISTMESCK